MTAKGSQIEATPTSAWRLDTATFNKIKRIVYEKSGIALRDGKEAMVSARIAKRMRALGLKDCRQYVKHLMRDTTGREVVHLLDVISTNVTSFFREPQHFDFLRDRFSEWLQAGQRRFRLWSAACSTGEEPYSIAMTLLSVVDRPGIDIKILATDISTRVLARCRAGVYEFESLKTVPASYQDRFFTRKEEDGAIRYKVKDRVKQLVVFRRLNLSEMPFPMRGPMDVIFCRNVMIYFDRDLCRRLLAEMYRLLRPDGYLMAGHAESLTCMLSDFKSMKYSIYAKEGPGKTRGGRGSP